MADKCNLHPGRNAVWTYDGVNYCQQCKDHMATAVAAVDRHVEPKDCFITYDGGDVWRPLSGTGCAHWVSHQNDTHQGQPGDCCLRGFTYRVRVLAGYLRSSADEITDLANVAVDDIWVDTHERHCGIVCRLQPDPDPTHADVAKTIVIRHDSSGQHRVAENTLLELTTHLGHGPGRGRFYRE